MHILATRRRPLGKSEYGLVVKVRYFADIVEAHKARNSFLDAFVHGESMAKFVVHEGKRTGDPVGAAIEYENRHVKIVDLADLKDGDVVFEADYLE